MSLEPVAGMLRVWYPELLPGVGTTLIQLGQAQCRLNKGVLLAPLPSRGYVKNLIDQPRFWLICFQQVSFPSANAVYSKMEVLSNVCPF